MNRDQDHDTPSSGSLNRPTTLTNQQLQLQEQRQEQLQQQPPHNQSRYASHESLHHRHQQQQDRGIHNHNNNNLNLKKRHSAYSLLGGSPTSPGSPGLSPQSNLNFPGSAPISSQFTSASTTSSNTSNIPPPAPLAMPSHLQHTSQGQGQGYHHSNPHHPSRPPRNPARSFTPTPPVEGGFGGATHFPAQFTAPSAQPSTSPQPSGAPAPQPFLSRKLKGTGPGAGNYRNRPSTADSVFAPSFGSGLSSYSAFSSSTPFSGSSSPHSMGDGMSSASGSVMSGGSKESKDREKERKQVTPWEFQEVAEGAEREVAVPTHLGSVPEVDNLGVGAKITGRVEEVTPWEMYAPPVGAEVGNGNGGARSSTNTSILSSASASTSTSSTGKTRSRSGSSSNKSGSGKGMITPTPYGAAVRFSSLMQKGVQGKGKGQVNQQQQQLQQPQWEMREIEIPVLPSTSAAASRSTSTLGSFGSVIHRSTQDGLGGEEDEDESAVLDGHDFSRDTDADSGIGIGVDVDNANVGMAPTSSTAGTATMNPNPSPASASAMPLKSSPSLSSLPPASAPSFTSASASAPSAPSSSKRPAPLRSTSSSVSVVPSLSSAVSRDSSRSFGKTTGSVEDVTPWEMYPAPSTSVPPVPSLPSAPYGGSGYGNAGANASTNAMTPPGAGAYYPTPPTPPTPGFNKEKEKDGKKRRSSISMSLEERRKSASGGVAGAFAGMGLGLGKVKTREREKERSGSVVGHPGVGVQGGGAKEKETRVATGLKEDVTPWELEDAVPPLPRHSLEEESGVGEREGDGEDTAQYISIDGGDRKKSASGTPTPNTAVGTGGTGRARGSMTLEQMEEVMPWELYPIPTAVGPASAAASNGSAGVNANTNQRSQAQAQRRETHPNPPPHQQPPRQSNAASTSGSTFADFGLKRRKSTGGGAVKAKNGNEKDKHRELDTAAVAEAMASALAGTSPGSSSSGGRQTTSKEARERSRLSGLVGISASATGVVYSDVNASSSASTPSPSMSNTPTSPMASSSYSHVSGSSSSVTHAHNASMSSTLTSTPTSIHAAAHAHINGANNVQHDNAQANGKSGTPRFSTADRTILEQIKAGLQAREAQFVIKGVGHTVVGGGRSKGKKYHPYKKEVVPYPRSYGREVVDLDVWETMFCMEICESLTWHVFETPPTKVLEIGCGTGTWILHCARTWKDCHFVGLDVVPLHPDLQNVGSPDLASRITWVQHNFLESLPFQNEEFDFVHIKRIALGVPEDKWDPLLEEISRVMKPGGAFEIIEEDLFFPGKKVDDDSDIVSDVFIGGDDDSLITRRNSLSSDRHSTDKLPQMPELDSPVTPTSAHVTPSGRLPSRPPSPSRHGQGIRTNNIDREVEDQDVQRALQQDAKSSSSSIPTYTTNGVPLHTPHSRSTARPSLSVKTQTRIPKDPYSELAAVANSSLYGSNVGILGGMGYVVTQDPFMMLLKQQKRERAEAAAAAQITSQKNPPSLSNSMVNPTGHPPPKSITDPRDHTILEAIWNGMLETRFVNPAPLSLLTTYLEYHFTDVRTHPPLMYSFPPQPVKQENDEDEDEDNAPTPPHHEDSEPDIDDARDAIVSRPKRPRSTKSSTSRQSTSSNTTAEQRTEDSGEVKIESGWENMHARLQKTFPYVTLDASRGLGRFPVSKRGSKLPNTTLNIDLRSLNLHLALRAKEVIACSEPMWEWVLERHSLAEKEATQGGRYRSGSTSIEGYMVGVQSSASEGSVDLTQSAILEMTRDDFDHLLNNFQMDMQDKASVGLALQERFNWHVFTSPITQDRKAFDTACEKFDKWVAEEKEYQISTGPYRQTATHRSRNSMSASSPGLVPLASDIPAAHDRNLISRSISTPQPSTAENHLDDISSIVTAVNSRQDSNSSQIHLPSSSVSQLSTYSQPLPPQRQSRAMRVFVAWKAS